MKSNMKFLAVALVCLSAIMFSCKKSVPGYAKYIPKSSTIIVGFDAKSMQQKLMSGGLSLDSAMKSFDMGEGSKKENPLQKLNDLQNSGIDWSSRVYVFMSSKGGMMGSPSMDGGAVAKLDDSKKFEAYLKKEINGLVTKTESDVTWANLGEGIVIGWNKSAVIVTGEQKRYTYGEDKPAAPADAASKKLIALFKMQESESVASVTAFKEFSNEKGDISFWSNSTSSVEQIPFIGTSKATDLFKETYSTGIVNFENGKIDGKFKAYFNKDMADIIKKNPAGNADMALVENYPSKSINGLAVFNFNPNVIADILKFTKLESIANSKLQEYGFTIDDAVKAFKGDIAFVVSDFTMQPRPSTYDPAVMTTSPSVKWLLNAKVNNKAALDKVLSYTVKQQMLVNTNGVYNINPTMARMVPAWVEADSKSVIIASDTDIFTKYKAGTEKAVLPAAAKDKISGKQFGMYVDILSITKNIPVDSSINMEMYTTAMKGKDMFKDAWMNTEKPDGATVNSQGVINMVNEKDNSLVQIVRYFTEIGKAAKADDAKRKTTYDYPATDSAMAVPEPPMPSK